ncbi:MAG: hypothetical protein AAGB11_05140 [Pseudomonadota bacterium]
MTLKEEGSFPQSARWQPGVRGFPSPIEVRTKNSQGSADHSTTLGPYASVVDKHLKPRARVIRVPSGSSVEKQPTRREQECCAPEPAPADHDVPWPVVLRDIRRIWMGAPFKTKPAALLLMNLRPHTVDGQQTPKPIQATEDARKSLSAALREVGMAHCVEGGAICVVLPGRSARNAGVLVGNIAAKLASPEHPSDGMASHSVHLAAGVVDLYRDEDPAVTLALAHRCLERALTQNQPAVIEERHLRGP